MYSDKDFHEDGHPDGRNKLETDGAEVRIIHTNDSITNIRRRHLTTMIR